MAELFSNPWFLLCALLACPQLLKQIGRFIHHLVDQQVKENESLQGISAGEWIQTVIQGGPHRDTIRVEREDGPLGGIDAYWPSRQALVLRPETYQSSRSVAYNIAAHEYGHGLTYSSSPLVGYVLNAGRTIQGLSGLFVSALVFTSVFNAEPDSSWAVHVLFGVLLTANGLVLVDEALASLHAHRILSEHSPHDPSPLHLFTAWSAYALMALGRVIQWIGLPAILVFESLHLAPSDLPFSFNATLFLGVLSIILLKRGLTVSWRAWKNDLPRTRSGQLVTLRRDAVGAFAGGLGALIFAFFAAQEASQTPWNLLVFLCLIPASSPLVALGESLVSWPFKVLVSWTSKSEDTSGERLRDAPSPPTPLTNTSVAFSRVFAFFQLTYLPLLIFWWYARVAAFTL